jgi:hypothetical protein
MSPRIKKLIGFAVFLPAFAAYCFLAAGLSEFAPDHPLLKAGYFLIAGVAWAFPAKFLMQWMNRPPRAPAAPERLQPRRRAPDRKP